MAGLTRVGVPRVAGLILAVTLVSILPGCTGDPARRDLLRAGIPYLGPIERPVIVVPGFGVSRLKDPASGNFVWGTARNTVVLGYEDDLDLPIDGDTARDRLVPDGFVGSRGPINTAWQLSEGLRKYGGYAPSYRDSAPSAHNLFPLAWDWRRDLRHGAGELGELARRAARVSSFDGRVDIVAHSAGGLLVLTWLRTDAGAAALVRNVILVGAPEQGTVDAIRVFARPEQFVRRRFDPKLLVTWPGLAQLIPREPVQILDENGRATTLDFREPEAWAEAGLVDAADSRDARAWAHALDIAAEWRREFEQPLPPSVNIVRIASDCVPTPVSPVRRSNGSWVFYEKDLAPAERHLARRMFTPGDGTVSVDSGTAGDPTAMLFCEGHQGLTSSPQVHRAIIRQLRGWEAGSP